MVYSPNIGNILTRTAVGFGDRVGLVRGGEVVLWRELERDANALAAALVDLGLRFDDRVVIQSPNTREMFESMYAIARTGGVYAPVNARSSEDETVQMIGLCDAKIAIFDAASRAAASRVDEELGHVSDIVVVGDCELPTRTRARWHRYADLVRAYADAPTVSVDVQFEDVCWHGFTSGTTGVPKGALNTHGGLHYSLLHRIAEVTPGLGSDDCMLVVAPISHGTGTMTTANALVGARIVIPEETHFDAAAYWKLIQEHRVTTMFVVPTILMRLLNHESAWSADMSSLRHVVLTGAAITVSDLDRATDMLGDALVQYYGAAESVGAGTVIRPARHPSQRNLERRSIGRPRIGSELKIAGEDFSPLPFGEVGEICVRGPGLFRGYYNDPKSTTAVLKDGWYRTGDLGFQDRHGFVYLTGRIKEMFKCGGLQVYPNEIQDHLSRHPAVDEAHVLAVPDSDLGEVGLAVVVLKSDAPASEPELSRHLSERLARYKIPRRIFVLDEVPRSANGKVPKQLLRSLLIERGLIEAHGNVPPMSGGAAAHVS